MNNTLKNILNYIKKIKKNATKTIKTHNTFEKIVFHLEETRKEKKTELHLKTTELH